MKKIILSLSILVGLMAVSCERADLPQEQNANNDNSLMRRQRQSSMFNYIQSTRIDNGVNCENNILIFPSWDDYWKTVERLDEMVESDCKVFDSTVPNNISEERYNTLADAAGFDEDNVLRRFEEDLAFCSLRSKIESLERVWLSRQGDRGWDANADPDNHFIQDQAERALLSSNGEVIVNDGTRGYVYYKFLNDKGNRIEVINNDLKAISQVSQGKIPTENPNVIVVTPGTTRASYGCRTTLYEGSYEFSGLYAIKRSSWVEHPHWFSPSKIISKTRGYKKINGVWRPSRLLITVGINGQSSNTSGTAYVNCNQERTLHLFKEKRRRLVSVKTANPLFSLQYFGIRDNKLYSYHKRGNLIVNKDFYDM
jgi:hypothetical protein